MIQLYQPMPYMAMLWQWFVKTWWRHQMETFSALLAICAGNSPVNSSLKGQWRGALMLSLICIWIISWVNSREGGNLRPHRAHYDVIVMNHEIQKSRNKSWRRHQMEAFLALLALCAGNSPVIGEFPSQRVSNADNDVYLMWVRISC